MAQVEEIPGDLLDEEVEEEDVDTQRRKRMSEAKKRAMKNKAFWKNVNIGFSVAWNLFLGFLVLFFATAVMGGILQLISPPSAEGGGGEGGDGSNQDEVNWASAKEAAIIAAKATWLAIKTWTRLLLAILVPTSYRTFLITKESW